MGNAYRETEYGSAEVVSAEPILAWKVHLLRENPWRVLLITPFVLASLLVCYITFRSLLPMTVVLFLFTSSLAEYLFPISYEITNLGASSHTLIGRTSIEWDRVRKYYLDDHGIKLSPLREQGRLEAYRGVYLRFGSHQDKVIEAVRRMRNAEHADDGSGGPGTQS